MPEVVTPDWVKHAVFYQIFLTVLPKANDYKSRIIWSHETDGVQTVDVPLSGLQGSDDQPQVLDGNAEGMQRNGDTINLTLPAQRGVILSL